MARNRRAQRRYNLCYYWTSRSHESCIEYALGGRVGSPENGNGQSNYGQAKSMVQISEQVSEDFKKYRSNPLVVYGVIFALAGLAYWKFK